MSIGSLLEVLISLAGLVIAGLGLYLQMKSGGTSAKKESNHAGAVRTQKLGDLNGTIPVDRDVPFDIPPKPEPVKIKPVVLIAFVFGIALFVSPFAATHVLSPKSGIRYADGVTVSMFDMHGHSPEYLEVSSGSIYFLENGSLFVMKNGEVREITLRTGSEPDHVYKAAIMHMWGQDIYVATQPETMEIPDENGQVYEKESHVTFLRVRNGGSTVDNMLTRALNTGWAPMADFAVSNNGSKLFYILFESGDYNMYYFPHDEVRDVFNTGGEDTEPYDLQHDVPADFSPQIALDKNHILYVSIPAEGFIRCLLNNARATDVFAGQWKSVSQVSAEEKEGIRGLSDYGPEPLFQSPTALATDTSFLYVLDSGLIRRIPLDGDLKDGIYTLAGKTDSSGKPVVSSAQSVEADTPGKDVVFNVDNHSYMTIDTDGYLLLTSAGGLVYQIDVTAAKK